MFFFYWLIAIMPLDQHRFWGQPLFGTFTPVKVLGLVALLVAVFQMMTSGKFPQLLQSTQARWYTAFVVFQCSSYLFQGGQLVYGFTPYTNVFSIVSLLIAVLTLINSRQRLYHTILVAIGAVGFSSLYTIRQQQKYGDITYFRPGGMLGDANEYALVVGLWMPLAFVWAFSKRPRWERALCFGCLASTLLGTTFAASRGGFLGLAAAFLFLIWRSQHRVRNLVIVTTLLVPLLLLSPSSPLQRFKAPSYGDQLAQQARLITWRAGLKMIQSHPLTGIGINNFKPYVTAYENPGENVASLAHNTYVEIAAELGLPALIVFLGLFASSFIALERIRRRANATRLTHLANIAVGIQAGLCSYLVSAVFVSAWWQKLVWLLLFLTICVNRLGSAAVSRHQRRILVAVASRRPTVHCAEHPPTPEKHLSKAPATPDRHS
jgi:hypothetical protein